MMKYGLFRHFPTPPLLIRNKGILISIDREAFVKKKMTHRQDQHLYDLKPYFIDLGGLIW
jgi:hypothetical protein